MVKYRPRKSRTTKFAKKKKTTKKPMKRISKQIRTISRKIEDKQAFTYITSTAFNSGIDSPGDMIQIVPNIAQGTADNQRIGDQITAKSMNIKGFLRFLPQPTSAINNSQYGQVAVRLMVLSLKQAANYDTAVNTSSSLATLLKKGGTTTYFTGVISDLYAPINTDVFVKHYNKVFYLNQSYMLQPVGAANQSALAVDISKLVRFFNIKVPCRRKTLKYDRGVSSALLPTNFAPFLCAGYVYLNGASPDILSTNLQVSFDVALNYEDA